MIIAVCFTNLGPYHLARLRALAQRLEEQGDRLIAYEMAAKELTYPWTRTNHFEPFQWNTLFPHSVLETLTPQICMKGMITALNRDFPDVISVAGYARPESVAAARWARKSQRLAILMSESQRIDRRRIWWKEMMKRRRVRLFNAALVGAVTHREYLIDLGMSSSLISLGYNAVDNSYFQRQINLCRESMIRPPQLPKNPFFLSVCRFVPEKNLFRLIEAFTRYRVESRQSDCWDLVLCGDGPQFSRIQDLVTAGPCASAIHCPGFQQLDELVAWYAYASAFVLPSISEPWGLVGNEAANAGVPLLISSRAGCVRTLVPDPRGTTGATFDPLDVDELADRLTWMATLPEKKRQDMGQTARYIISQWGPDRFAVGMLEAVALATSHSEKPPQQYLQVGNRK